LEQDKRKPVQTRFKTELEIFKKKEAIMPGFNQNGPMGQGPMTGRRMGRCTNFGANQKNTITTPEETPEETRDEESLPENNLGRGQGLGRGKGGLGRGMGLGQGMGLGRGQGGFGRGMGRQNRFRGGV
jgi:hypothetical protein